MTFFDRNNSKLKRGCEKVRRHVRANLKAAGLWCVPASMFMVLADSRPAKGLNFWVENQLWAPVIFGSALLLILGENVSAWIKRAGNGGENWAGGESRGPRLNSAAHSSVQARGHNEAVDVALIHDAQDFQEIHRQGTIDLNEKCAGFHPVFKLSLARETVCLAGQAGVCENAAFLALMKQLEH